MRDRIVAELEGDVKEEERITQLDSIVVTRAAAPGNGAAPGAPDGDGAAAGTPDGDGAAAEGK